MSNSEFLQPLEQMIAAVIDRHPEYHALLKDPERALNTENGAEFSGINPFLHMSLHIAILEQVQTDRPPGVVNAYTAMLNSRKYDAHAVEHRMMECLSASLEQAQRDAKPPDEEVYIACLRRLR
jgi:hypothetical protein